MIRSFGDKPTVALFHDEVVLDFQGFARVAKRKLAAIPYDLKLARRDLKPEDAERIKAQRVA